MRNGFKIGLGTLVLAGALGLCSVRGAVAVGTVFEDRNANGVFDPGEPGLQGIAVSNGIDVVRTDATGRYKIDAREKAAVFVIKPRGFQTRVDDLGLPRFYYLHEPGGTPDGGYLFKGVAPTGPLPERIDFPLKRQEESDDFSAAVIADPQAFETKELAWYARDTIPELIKRKPLFGIALGDLVGDNLDLQPLYNEVNAKTGFPWYNVIGNHDLNYMAVGDEDADSTYRRIYGPSTYAFQYGRVHFIVLHNIFWKGFAGLKKDGFPKSGGYEGRLRASQLSFVGNYLSGVPKDELIIVCTHIPMFVREEKRDVFTTPQFPELLKLLEGRPHTLSLSGHVHVTYSSFFGAENGYQAPGNARHLHLSAPAACGSWYAGPLDQNNVPMSIGRDGTPAGFLWLEVKGTSYQIRFVPLRRPTDEQMRVYVPDTIGEASVPGKIVVNFFTGNSSSVVSYRMEGQSEAVVMRRVFGTDPSYVALRERANSHAKTDSYRVLPPPLVTDHLWEAELPKGLKPGVHRLDVEARNPFGEPCRSSALIRVLREGESLDSLDRKGNRRLAEPKEKAAETSS